MSDSHLMHRWMGAQPFHGRIRGWASLARKRRWFDSWRHWPHWVRLGMKGSPRYWIYAAGSELFFRLSSMGECGSTCPDGHLRTWREWLPVHPEQAKENKISPRQLASEINWNYQQFLMETSS